ncbi:MAG TPA: hypothetical protein VK308_09505 [Pyrinomonadaceae bacterium]|nr:hypothetical protein [Pyrinomonadaceae bacterium]
MQNKHKIYSKIANNIIIPTATVIPPRNVIKTQKDVELFTLKHKEIKQEELEFAF